MADGLIDDDEGNSSDSLADSFLVNVLNLIMDGVVQSQESRFVRHKQLSKDVSCLDQDKFKTITEIGLEDG